MSKRERVEWPAMSKRQRVEWINHLHRTDAELVALLRQAANDLSIPLQA
jgi:hypothetical protein